MERESSLKIDSSSVSAPVVVTMVCLYIFFRSMSSTTPAINLIKGKFRSVTGLLLKLSIFSSTVYSIVLYYLSTKFQIDKIALELLQTFDKHYVVNYREYSIDLGLVLVSALKLADILFTSCIFFCISVIAPSTKYSTSTFSNTISIASKLWAVFRIPIVYYADGLGMLINEKLALFMMLVFFNIELMVAAFFVLFLRLRSTGLKKSHSDAGFLSLCLFLYGFLKYSINFIDFPFKIDSNILGLIYSFQYALSISIYLLMAGIVFPRKETSTAAKEKTVIGQSNSVAMLEEVIEFEELQKLKPIN
ncbi:uncharacterized protein VICG_01638 [Vittaforma corneae ATCC 50505]|uniref:Uncharacterized protein n=1 Tax=Vittaforma corneae (strain ATCC 50505) TaxID=993615 RepID=L2GL81_VITCO|nr:uncharacterized protein VICG_01638 [Vittaforma corneae ATCC 50505]ELA41265.1 hypothetical protein VICG_01638 [Vittaforma corneae ATCC 50505]